MNTGIYSLVAILLIFSASGAQAIDTGRPDVQSFIAEMVARHGFDHDRLVATLNAAESRQPIIDSISKPAERSLTWGQYRNIFLTEKRIAEGAKFWRASRPLAAHQQRKRRSTGNPRGYHRC